MPKLWELIDGKKTYIISALIAVVGYLFLTGSIDQKTALFLLSMLGGGGMASQRSATAKLQKCIEDTQVTVEDTNVKVTPDV